MSGIRLKRARRNGASGIFREETGSPSLNVLISSSYLVAVSRHGVRLLNVMRYSNLRPQVTVSRELLFTMDENWNWEWKFVLREVLCTEL